MTANEDINNLVEYAKNLCQETKPDIRVYISRDRMSAFIEVVLPENCLPLTSIALYNKLEQMNIRYGIDHTAVNQALTRPGLKFPCANGTPPQKGADAEIKYHFTQKNKGRPSELKDGKVDFKNLNLFTIVHAGELLAEKTPATPGIPGTDVLGLTIPATPGKDTPLLLGKNVKLVNETQAFANVDGQLFFEKDRIHVLPTLTITGDVDLSTGNIDFIGNVTVQGNVTEGFSIKASGIVDIEGMINGGNIISDKLIVRHGIQGMNKGLISTSGDIIAQFIENANIVTDGNVIVNNVIMHSRIEAHKSVILKSQQGQIVGGIIQASENIITHTAGRPRASVTELRAGLNPSLIEEQRKILWQTVELKQKLDKLDKSVTMLKNADYNSLSFERKQALQTMTTEQASLTAALNIANERIKEINNLTQALLAGKVQITGAVYPGVTIYIGEQSKPITDSLRNVEFTHDSGILKIKQIQAPHTYK